MIFRDQVIDTKRLALALRDASLAITDDAGGLAITLSAPAAVMRLEVSPEGHPHLVVNWFEDTNLHTYEAAPRPLQSATGTASSSVASWQVTRTSYAPQNGAADDANGR